MNTKRLALILVGILYFAYLLVFSGSLISNDERYIIDTTNSFAIHQSLLLSQTGYMRGLQTTDVEPAQPVLAVPLYWLVYHIPWIGNVHGIYLFNPIVTALAGGVFFFYILALGYDKRMATLGTLLFGLTTIVWPYAQTFFREPLAMLSMLLTAYCIERWRRAFSEPGRAHWGWLLASLLTTAMALLVKEAILVALPGFVALAYPGWRTVRMRWREVLLILGVTLGLALAITIGISYYKEELAAVTGRYDVLAQILGFPQRIHRAGPGLLGFLVSPGKSVWMYSPLLILALGAPLVHPPQRWRESWLPLVWLFWFAFAYATKRAGLWHGGSSWGPRYMMPLTPFLMVAALAPIQRALESPRTWPKVGIALLALLGLAIQIGGTYVNLHAYYAYSRAQTGDVAWLGRPIWDPRWSQAIGSLLYIPQASPNIVWLMCSDWVSLRVILAALAALIAGLVWIFRRRTRAAIIALPLVLIPVVTLFVLSRAYPDHRFRGGNEELQGLRQYIEANISPEDIVVLSSPSYVDFFVNYYKGDATWYSLPLSPGERYSFRQYALLSDTPDDLVAPEVASLMGHFSASPGILLLVVDTSPVFPWSVRPPEWYLARHFYEIDVQEFGDRERLVRFLTVPAPEFDEAPAHPIGAAFGDTIRLVGWDATNDQTAVAPGGTWGLSLLWQALAPPEGDYTVGLYIVDANGQVALQGNDHPPQGGFEPTHGWLPGERIRDNFGFVVPSDMPPGEYEVWVALYSWPSLERLPVRGPDDADWNDHAVLTTLTVAP
jgi:4-amino-4-deoxy-L-arabinose transferase-like glycosyltransferase